MPGKIYCWDSGIFISILKGEQRNQEEMSGLREMMDLVDRGEVRIITSAVAKGEVLNHPSSADARSRFDALFQRKTFFMVETTGPIWEKIASIREATKAYGRRIEIADAAYIATAIAHRAEALHTFDEHDLIPLSGLECVDRLVICRPHGEQTSLGL